MSSIRISRDALFRNWQKAVARAGGRVIAVVKGNGYGMGLEGYSRLLQTAGAEFFAVGCAGEALRLRDCGIEGEILVLSPVWGEAELRALEERNVLLSLCGPEHVRELCRIFPKERRPRAHVALDTGMHRYGFGEAELPDLIGCADRFEIEGAYTHFGSPRSARRTAAQHARFLRQAERLRSSSVPVPMLHCCATQSFLRYPAFHHDAVRLGTYLVGALGDAEPIWRLEAPVLALRQIRRGEKVGYGGCPVRRGRTVAILGVGYGDGVMVRFDAPLSFRGRAGALLLPRRSVEACWGDVRLPVLGGPGVGHMQVDVTGLPIRIGDCVALRSNPLLLSPNLPRLFE